MSDDNELALDRVGDVNGERVRARGGVLRMTVRDRPVGTMPNHIPAQTRVLSEITIRNDEIYGRVSIFQIPAAFNFQSSGRRQS